MEALTGAYKNIPAKASTLIMMVAKKHKQVAPPRTTFKKNLPWISFALAILLLGAGIWYLSDKVSLPEIGHALSVANSAYILAGVAIMVLTIGIKTWRWQYLLETSHQKAPFMPLFWANILGQYVNLILPFVRLGEIARIVTLYQQTGIPKTRALGTLVVEKTLELIMFALTMAILLPFVILPDIVTRPTFTLGAIPLGLLVLLYLLAYQTQFVVALTERVAQLLPSKIGNKLVRLAVGGLEGLSALRNPRASAILIISSALIGVLYVALPFVLFAAFNISLNFAHAALVHVAVSVAVVPPSTPAKIGVFNGVVALVLFQLGIEDEAIVVGYSIVFYLVVIIPQLVLGSIAASRTKWQRSHLDLGSGNLRE